MDIGRGWAVGIETTYVSLLSYHVACHPSEYGSILLVIYSED